MGFLRSKTKKSDNQEEEEENNVGGDNVAATDKKEEEEKTMIPELPSERDRKAIMGCISCVLRLVFTHPNAITFVTKNDHDNDDDNKNEDVSKDDEETNNAGAVLEILPQKDEDATLDQITTIEKTQQQQQEKEDIVKKEEDIASSSLPKSTSTTTDETKKISSKTSSNTSFLKSKQIRNSLKKNSTATTTTANKRQSSKAVSSSSSSITIQNLQNQQKHRNLAFQKELLSKLSSYLLLDEGYSTVYIELLNKDDDSNHYTMEREFYRKALGTYLSSFSNEENGYKCLVLLLFRFLLLSSSGDDGDEENNAVVDNVSLSPSSSSESQTSTIVGYDARVRRVFKCLAVAIFTHFEQQKMQKEEQDKQEDDDDDDDKKKKTNANNNESGNNYSKSKNQTAPVKLDIENNSFEEVMVLAHTTQDEKEAFSSRKFEALEDDVGRKLKMVSLLLEEQQRQLQAEKGGGKKRGKAKGGSPPAGKKQISERKREKTNRQKVIRGLKIGTAGVVAGTLLAVTGGMAAPAIAAGIAAVAGGTAIATVATIALSSAAAVSTVFGVGGGALVAAKMDKRTRGLTEFQINLEEIEEEENNDDDGNNKEAIMEKHAELSRTVCISGWLRDENDFRRPWGATLHEELRDNLTLLRWFFSIKDPSTMHESSALLNYYEGNEDELWSSLRGIYGKDPHMLLASMVGPREDAALTDWEDDAVNNVIEALGFPRPAAKRQLEGSASDEACKDDTEEGRKKEDESKSVSSKKLPTIDTVPSSGSDENTASISDNRPRKGPKNVSELWDFHSEYGGELYTVRWESQMIQGISNSVRDLAKDLAGTTTKEVLKHTTMATLMTAIALPAGILTVANMIDSSWTIAMERANEAGVELAHSLLESDAGHRPISLVGYSLGARVIYKCMRELARHQEKWELQQERKGKGKKGLKRSSIGEKSSGIPHTISEDGDEGDDYSTMDSTESKNKSKEEEINYIREPASIVEDVILMGCPVSVNAESWVGCQRVIGGRFINCFSREDMILTLMFRYKNMKSMFRSVAGISPLNIPGIENYDVSSYIKFHSDYCFAVKDILALTGYGQPRLAGMTQHYKVVPMETGDEINE